MIGVSIQKFIYNTIEKEKMTRKDFAQKAGLTYSTLNESLNTIQKNPTLKTILKIANSFDTSINTVIGLSTPPSSNFKVIQPEEALRSLRHYIKNKLTNDKIKPRMLEKQAGISTNSIAEFIKEPPVKNSLGTYIISKLAQHWDVSIDEMIGRTEHNQKQTRDSPQAKSKSFVDKLTQRRLNSTDKSRSR